MTTSYTYVSRKNNNLFQYPTGISKIRPFEDVYTFLSDAKKIAYAIKNYPARKSFYFDEWNDLNIIIKQLIKELGQENCSKSNIYFNEFTIIYKNEKFEVSRNFSSDLHWKTYDITKIT